MDAICTLHKRGVTLLELLVVVAITQVLLIAFLDIADRSVQAGAWSSDALRCLTLAENELEWWSSASDAQRARLVAGQHPFRNPTAVAISPPFSANLAVEPLGSELLRLCAHVHREHAHRPVDITIETVIAKKGGARP